jgi:hypothetical protein
MTVTNVTIIINELEIMRKATAETHFRIYRPGVDMKQRTP